MENIDRKEHETSATIAEADGLAELFTLQPPTKVIGCGHALHGLSDSLHSHQIDLISAPPDRF